MINEKDGMAIADYASAVQRLIRTIELCDSPPSDAQWQALLRGHVRNFDWKYRSAGVMQLANEIIAADGGS